MDTRKPILVTGGGGFLGSHLVEHLRATGYTNVIAPRRREFDLTRAYDVSALFRAVRPEIVIHAAAVVGGIGANRLAPGQFFYENLLMGIQVIEAARRHGVGKTVVLGTICAYPKFTPVPFREAVVSVVCRQRRSTWLPESLLRLQLRDSAGLEPASPLCPGIRAEGHL